jgi:predicted kinase
MSKRQKTNVVYIPVGVPGSGKSTWFANQGFDPNKTAYVSMDDIRGKLCGDVSDQSQNAKVGAIAKSMFTLALSIEIPVVYWDATSVKRKYRKELISLAKKAGYKVVAVFFDIPLEVSKVRNAGRDRVVPEHVLDAMYKSMTDQPPTKDEGFDKIIRITD